MTITPDQPTRDLAVQHPETVGVLEALGIDYCCGGGRTLADACKRANIEWSAFVELLHEAHNETKVLPIRWTATTLGALCRHIVAEHHAYVRRATPEIELRLEKVLAKHGAAHPEVRAIQQAFGALAEELALHMMREERVLFPRIVRLESGIRSQDGDVGAPIAQLIAEHDDAGALMARIRRLTGGYQPPASACPTFRALYHSLAEFERDLHQHVHLENNILFPDAVKMEKQTPSV